MQSLLIILRTFSRDRLRLLEKFINSPYHVTHPGVAALFEQLKNNLESPPEREALVAALCPADPKRLYHLCNYLVETLEKFLANEQVATQTHQQHADTVAALRKLQLPDVAAGMLRYARRKLEQDTQKGLAFHEAEYRLHTEAYHLSLQQGRAKAFNAQQLSDAQDVAFICAKLRTGCLLLSHQSVSKQIYDKGLLDPVLNFLTGHPYLEIPAVAVYYHGYFAQLGGSDSEHHFSRLKILLQEHAGLFSTPETHDLFLMAINFCIRNINRQQETYFREIFELYQSGLRHGALLEDGVLSRWTYNNIISTSLRLREFDWSLAFLHEYAPQVSEEHREGARHFNLARYHYEKGELREAMQHLLFIEYDDVLQNLTAKILLSKIYFRLDESDALENHLDSIQIYIRRKKLLGYHRDNYMAFVKFTRKLLLLNMNDPAERLKLKKEIELAPVLTERNWLLENL